MIRSVLKPHLLYTATLLIIFVGCYTVPETGRTSLNFISTGNELQLGASEFEKLKREETISSDPTLNGKLQRVGRRIARAVGSDLPSAQWEFVLFDDPNMINAFALPGGKVGVYTGIMDVATTDDELATVIGHEIAHVTARHGSERMSQGITAALIGLGLNMALDDDKNRDAWVAAYGAGAAYVVTFPFSRKHELEADEIGVIYAARAGFNPEAAIEFWMKMNLVKQGNEPSAFFATHPSDFKRIDRLEALMPKVKPIYEQNKNNR
ncbi:MAG: M48 family metallopeptidase [Verrucomicrobia bacterium]|nr:M48 family metallopeptidase [Verrucomicrobiota bacterium]